MRGDDENAAVFENVVDDPDMAVDVIGENEMASAHGLAATSTAMAR